MRCCQIASPVPLQRWSGFILVLLVILLFAGGKAILFDTLDPDFFWHYRVAQQLSHDGIGPIVDSISFASSKAPWTPYSWLAELAMKSIWDRFGITGAVITQSLMVSGIFFFISLACRQKPWKETNEDDNQRLLATILATALAAGTALPYLSFRPATAATFILSIISFVLLRDRRLNERSKLVWIVPLLTALCVNLHFFAILSVLWTGALLAGALWEKYWNRDGETQRRLRRVAILNLSCIIAFLSTPMLPGMLKAVFTYRTNDPMVYSRTLAEFIPFWVGVKGAITAAIVLCAVACVISKSRKLRAGEIIWLCGTLLLAVELGRFLSIAMIILAPLVSWTLPKLSDRPLESVKLRYATALVALLCIWRIGSNLPARESVATWLNRHGPDAPGYPVAAANYVAEHVSPRSHRLINEFTWGGYLAFRLGDQYQVLLDGRTQVHTPDFWREAYLGNPDQMRNILNAAQGDAAILPIERSRFRSTLASMGWVSIYKDERAEVMIPPTDLAKTAAD